jgi:hypothetical protein
VGSLEGLTQLSGADAVGLSFVMLPAVPTLSRLANYLLACPGPQLQHGLTVTETVVVLAVQLL